MKKSEVIYAFSFSRDCDMCESTSYHKFESQKEYDDYEENLYEWAEGSTYINEISEEEYLAHCNQQSRTRDRIMEAYENGNGRTGYV